VSERALVRLPAPIDLLPEIPRQGISLPLQDPNFFPLLGKEFQICADRRANFRLGLRRRGQGLPGSRCERVEGVIENDFVSSATIPPGTRGGFWSSGSSLPGIPTGARGAQAEKRPGHTFPARTKSPIFLIVLRKGRAQETERSSGPAMMPGSPGSTGKLPEG
jgi:hypothetical protein